nr:helitron helicase-like domain-containing protein [Tanacetum cinerariifolium]
MYVMTSFGACIDNSVNRRRGPYVFKISGQIYHLIGSLCPEPGNPPRFLQLYIYDIYNEVSNRMCHFSEGDSSQLDHEFVSTLIHLLDEHNELVRLFRMARDRVESDNVPEFHIRLFSVVAASEYDLLTLELPDPDTDLEGYRGVSEMMVHGPCGLLLSNTVCMKKGKCGKNFPKKFIAHTFFDADGYVHYGEEKHIHVHLGARSQPLTLIVNDEGKTKTTLTEWLEYNKRNGDGLHLTYIDFTKEFVWYLDTRSGRWRQRRNSCLIGHLANVYPTFGELFFLRMLLCHQKRFKTFDDIRTVNKRLYPTFRAACEALGLLGDDKEWLWKAFWRRMSDDVPRTVSNSLHIQDLYMNDSELEANENKQEMIFVYGHGETGKTFLWGTLINAMRSEGKIVLVVASSGIA